MKKIIIKTVAFSLALILTFGSLVYLILSTCAPSTLANLYFRLDNCELTLKYSEKAYDKSGDISDLSLLVERSIVFEDDAAIEKHATKLINDEGYGDFAAAQSSSYNYYIIGSLCSSLYALDKKSVAVDTAVSRTDNYTEVNPMRVVIILSVENGDKETLLAIKSSLERRENKNQLVINDISTIGEYLK